jgi:hypothetical protein
VAHISKLMTEACAELVAFHQRRHECTPQSLFMPQYVVEDHRVCRLSMTLYTGSSRFTTVHFTTFHINDCFKILP